MRLEVPEVRVGELGGAGNLGQDWVLGGRVDAGVIAEGLAVGRTQNLGVGVGRDLEEAVVILPPGYLVRVWVLLGSASK